MRPCVRASCAHVRLRSMQAATAGKQARVRAGACGRPPSSTTASVPASSCSGRLCRRHVAHRAAVRPSVRRPAKLAPPLHDLSGFACSRPIPAPRPPCGAAMIGGASDDELRCFSDPSSSVATGCGGISCFSLVHSLLPCS